MKNPTFRELARTLRPDVDAPLVRFHPNGGYFVLVGDKYLWRDNALHNHCGLDGTDGHFPDREAAEKAVAKWGAGR